MGDPSYEEQLKAANEIVYKHSLELARLKQELEIANAKQENLLHFISHEVKGYLAKGQNAFAGIVEGDYGEVSASVKSLSVGALGEMRKGVDTVMGILEASNFKKGSVTYQRENFDFKQAVVSVSDQLCDTAKKEKGLSCDIKIEPGEYALSGDAEKLKKHVIRNLIDNAIRYTPVGSISISLSKSPQKVVFAVKDSGVGISPDDMPRLFTEGGHGKDSIKVNVDSTGYGLYIAKQVVEAHGGTISAHSEGPGKGSTFTVELPTS